MRILVMSDWFNYSTLLNIFCETLCWSDRPNTNRCLAANSIVIDNIMQSMKHRSQCTLFVCWDVHKTHTHRPTDTHRHTHIHTHTPHIHTQPAHARFVCVIVYFILLLYIIYYIILNIILYYLKQKSGKPILCTRVLTDTKNVENDTSGYLQ